MRFVAIRKYIYIFSLLIILPGLVSLFWPGRDALNYGIDFKGGSILEVDFVKPADTADIRSVLAKYDLDREAQIQRTDNTHVLIRTKDLSHEQSSNIIKDLKSKVGEIKDQSLQTVGPAFGKELTMKAIYAVLIACVLMLIYITVRFEFKFGVGAIVSLLHDVLIILGLFSIFRWEVDSSFVAAVLTILGYSIMDTIVVYDRIRENMKLKRKESYEEIVDKSILQTLNRSINTVLTVLFTLAALFVFGGATIKTFVLALLIGVISGCYSSIFVASPVWYDLKIRENK